MAIGEISKKSKCFPKLRTTITYKNLGPQAILTRGQKMTHKSSFITFGFANAKV